MKIFKGLAVLFAAIISVLPLAACKNSDKNDGVLYLNVYNCEDYIADDEDFDMIEEFEKYYKEKFGKTVVVNYSTFGTLENMYNELQLSKVKQKDGTFNYAYDLVCASDYMIEKMYVEGMLEKFDYTVAEGKEGNMSAYLNNVSAYVYDLFNSTRWSDTSSDTWGDYAAAYMYGTMGFVYNPEVLGRSGEYVEGDAEHWDLPWKTYSKNLGTIKDSIRDTYALAIGYVYSDELSAIRADYKGGKMTEAEYNAKVNEIFNRTDKETVDKVTDALIVLKQNVYGFEVDSGKRDMAAGKIAINFAWSGDAVYTLDLAEVEDTELYYAVPEEGSNVWFDGWAMPRGANKMLAQEFVNFLSVPENAVHNMNFIGYTPAIAGETLYENCVDWYGEFILVEDEKGSFEIDGKKYTDYYIGDYIDENPDFYAANVSEDGNLVIKNALIPEYGDDDETIVGYEEVEELTLYPYDVSFLMISREDAAAGKNDYVVWTSVLGRQLTTQYPDEDTISRCSIMRYFDDTEMKRLNDMWDEVKISAVPVWLMWLIVAIIIVTVISVPLFTYLNKKGVRFVFKRKNKNLTPVSRQIIK